MTEFLQRYFAHQNFFDLCIHEKQRLRQALNLLSNLLLTKIQLCSVFRMVVEMPKFDDTSACVSPHSIDQTANALGAICLEDRWQKADFSGTVRDIRAPRSHERPSLHEVVRPLIGS